MVSGTPLATPRHDTHTHTPSKNLARPVLFTARAPASIATAPGRGREGGTGTMRITTTPPVQDLQAGRQGQMVGNKRVYRQNKLGNVRKEDTRNRRL